MGTDVIANRAYQAEWTVAKVMDQEYYTITEAKNGILNLIHSDAWRYIHDQAMQYFQYTVNVGATQVRKGKAQTRDWKAASVRWHHSLDRGLWASIVINCTPHTKDTSKLTIVHELAHYLTGPKGAHGPGWAASYIVLTKNLIGQKASEALAVAFCETGVLIDTTWLEMLDDMLNKPKA
jgi:putative metallohydrolase (TIGR04338 family)